MGGCLVLESLVLFHWCERNGLGPLGITGLSMGGHMASLAATNWPKPLVLVPCLSWSTASSVFTQGVMSQSINWDVLETQYFADGNYRERLSKMVTIIDDAFLAGQHFVQNFSASMQELKKDMKDVDEFIQTLPEENVNLTVVPQVPACIQPPQQKIVVLNGQSNKLNLSPSLLQKLLCTDKAELTTDEINELNTKIRIALHELKAENDSDEADAKEKKQLQSDTAAGDKTTIITSVYEFGKTKLISLISPSSNTNETKIVATTDTAAVAKLDKDKIFDVSRTKWWEREASQFMRGIMDECTHLKNFSVPYDTSLIIAVCAKDDAYIPRDGCSSLEDIWPGAEIRYLDAGHVSAFVLHQKIFRSSILEGFERAKKIYRENPQYRSQATVTSQTAPPVHS
jgi:Alpha/beta hydrolase domain containing 18